MAMKTMNLAKLSVWMTVVIHIFHFGAGDTFRWFKRGCSNYTFHEKKYPPLNWVVSRQLCNKTGLGDLVSIESKEEWIFLKNTTLKLTIADEYFIGLRKDDRSGKWRWLSNNRPSQTALPWATWEPSGDGNCASMYKDYGGDYGKYNDLPCKNQVKPGYICEFPVAGCNQDDNCQGVCLNHSPMPTNSTPSGTTKSTQWGSDSSTVYDHITASDSAATSSGLDGSEGDDSSTIVIVAASLAAVLFVVLIVLVVVLLLRRRKRRGHGKDEETSPKKSTHQAARLGENQYEPVDRVEAAKLLGTSDNNETEKKTESPPANCEYAVVNKKNKKRKEGDLVYAQLAEFDGANNDKTAQKPPSYEPTVYADVDVVPPKVLNSTSGDSTQPTYANVETTGV